MDKKGKKILLEYCENIRTPIKKIAKSAGISREVAAYRIKQYEKQGIITGYTARLNLSQFSHSMHFLLCKGATTKEKIPGVHWATTLSGEYNLLVVFSVKGIPELKKRIDYLIEILKPKEYTLHTLIEEYKDDFRPYFGTIKNPLTSIKPVTSKTDDSDTSILLELSKDAKQSFADIGTKINISGENVRYRIRQLENADTLLGYRAKINPKILGYSSFTLLIKLADHTPESFNKCKEILTNHPHTVYASRISGSSDILTEVFSSSIEEYNKILMELHKNLNIASISHNLILDVKQHSYF